MLSLIPQILWAIVAVFLALLFREPVSVWIRGLKVSWGDFKAEPQTLAQVERKVNENASAVQVSPKDVRGWELIVLKLLEREFGGNMRPDVRLHDVPFDAVTWGSHQGRVIGIQIKFASTPERAQAQIAPLVATAEQIARTYSKDGEVVIVQVVGIGPSGLTSVHPEMGISIKYEGK